MKSKLFVILFIYILLILPCESIILEAKQHPSFEKALASPTPQIEKIGTATTYMATESRSNSGSINYIQPESPLTLSKKLLYKGNSTCFVNDTVCVLVQANCLAGKKIDKVELWEYTDSELDLVYPTYFLRSSDIKELAEFERENFPLLYEDDITDFHTLSNKILNRDEYTSHYIKSKYLNCIANNSKNISFNNVREKESKTMLIDSLNNLLNDQNFYDEKSFQNISYNAKQIINRLRAGKPSNFEVLLSNRLLLEEIYPNEIKRTLTRLINSPIMDKLIKIDSFDDENDVISIPISDMYSRESVVYKYYIKPLKEGEYNTYTVARIIDDEGKLYDLYYPLQIRAINKKPEFNIGVDIAKLDLDEGTKTVIRYDIKYLGGSDDSCCYDIIIENSSQYIIERYNFTGNFSKGRTESIEANIIYPTSGTFNIPSVTINDVKYTVEEHVVVDPRWSKDLNRYYPIISTMIIIGSFILYLIEIRHIGKEKEKPDEDE